METTPGGNRFHPWLWQSGTGYLLCFGLNVLMASCALLLAAWARMGALPLAGLVGLGLSSVASEAQKDQESVRRTALVAALVCSAFIVVGALWSRSNIWDWYFAVVAWCIAGSAGLVGLQLPAGSVRQWWKRLSLAWACGGVLLWLSWAYLQDLRAPFYEGLFFAVVCLVICRTCFRPRAFGVQAANTGMLLCLVLPLLDLASGRHSVGHAGEVAGTGYSYTADKGDPRVFLAWSKRLCEQLERMAATCTEPDPTGRTPYRLKPNSTGAFFQSRFRINGLGFRGGPISRDKGNAYRIVALGESTTFGLGLVRDYRPWPELLQQMLNQRLKLSRPIQVINAGMPALSLEDNLRRLRSDILPLKPDLIISYHGWNGFRFFSKALPPVFGRNLPVFKPRPLRLLANCEYRLKMLYAKHLLMKPRALQPPPIADVMKSRFAQAYESLIRAASTHHIRLALANFSLAVNSKSPLAVVDFYRAAFPALYWKIRANQMHTRLLKELGREHSEVRLVNTHPYLDGRHELFIDAMHFTQEGDRAMARAMFAGIKDIIQKDVPPATAVEPAPLPPRKPYTAAR